MTENPGRTSSLVEAVHAPRRMPTQARQPKAEQPDSSMDLLRAATRHFVSQRATRSGGAAPPLLTLRGSFGRHFMTLSTGAGEAPSSEAQHLITAFVVSWEAAEAVLLSEGELILAEENGAPVLPLTRKRALQATCWRSGTVHYYHAELAATERNPATVQWTPLRSGYAFRGVFPHAIRRGLNAVRWLHDPENAEALRLIDELCVQVPYRAVVPVVAQALSRLPIPC